VEVLVDQGNVRDAALLACTAALADTWLPEATSLSAADGSAAAGDGRVCLILPNGDGTGAGGRPLACPRLLVPLTVGLWERTSPSGGGGASVRRHQRCQLIVDPTRDEQAALSGVMTVVIDAALHSGGSIADEKDESCILSVEMTGRVGLDTIAFATKLAKGRALELLPILRP
jgi:exosome complex RNA-binding protein Rrp42 (RNase PH superfamily)